MSSLQQEEQQGQDFYTDNVLGRHCLILCDDNNDSNDGDGNKTTTKTTTPRAGLVKSYKAHVVNNVVERLHLISFEDNGQQQEQEQWLDLGKLQAERKLWWKDAETKSSSQQQQQQQPHQPSLVPASKMPNMMSNMMMMPPMTNPMMMNPMMLNNNSNNLLYQQQQQQQHLNMLALQQQQNLQYQRQLQQQIQWPQNAAGMRTMQQIQHFKATRDHELTELLARRPRQQAPTDNDKHNTRQQFAQNNNQAPQRMTATTASTRTAPTKTQPHTTGATRKHLDNKKNNTTQQTTTTTSTQRQQHIDSASRLLLASKDTLPWIKHMYAWLTTVPHGKKAIKKVCSVDSATKVCRAINRLAMGWGIHHKNWPVPFEFAISNPATNHDHTNAIMTEALQKAVRDFHAQYPDTTGGWALRHPTQKFILFVKEKGYQWTAPPAAQQLPPPPARKKLLAHKSTIKTNRQANTTTRTATTTTNDDTKDKEAPPSPPAVGTADGLVKQEQAAQVEQPPSVSTAAKEHQEELSTTTMRRDSYSTNADNRQESVDPQPQPQQQQSAEKNDGDASTAKLDIFKGGLVV